MKKESAAGTQTPTAPAPKSPSAGGNHTSASPYKSAEEELDGLRRTLRSACQHYAKRIDMEIIRLRERVAAAGEEQLATEAKGKAAPNAASRFHDLRDIITLLRTLEVKPLAGRRKDLKKIESLVDELRLLLDRWG